MKANNGNHLLSLKEFFILCCLFFGIILAQVLLFAFWHGSVILWIDHYMFIPYLIGCAIFGAIYGDNFVLTLRRYIGEWWDLWGFWGK